MRTNRKQLIALAATAMLTHNVNAEPETQTAELAALLIKAKAAPGDVAAKLQNTREKHAGSVSTVTPEEMKLQSATNLGEIFFRIPGVNYIDEDGRGTKPNIGLRGLDPIRSQYVQLLHDGVPTQPSLYSEQAAYYGVPAERVAGIEVLKGGSSILYGPNTVGGVINLISRGPSEKPFAGVFDTRVSSYGDQEGNLFLSGTRDNFTYGLEYMKKTGDGFRDGLGYNIDDFEATFDYQITPDDSVQIHFQYYDEESETPGGLLPFQFNDTSASNKPNDDFFGERIELDIDTTHQLTENQKFETLTYAYKFTRDWFLQNYVNNNDASTTLADNNGQYLRDFNVFGFEPKYTLDYDLGHMTGNQLILGGRFYYDEVSRRSATGNTGTSRENDALLTAHDELTTTAIAAYVQNEFRITDAFSVVPGLRYENIQQTRIDRFAGTPEQEKNYDVFAPGLGLKYQLPQETLLYANATRSFRPPSFGDSFNPAIGASNLDLDSSTAWTYEAGVRTNPFPWFSADAGVFYTDFKDQVVVSGSTAANYDTRTYGFESIAQVGLIGLSEILRNGNWHHDGDHEFFLQAGATLLKSTFEGGAFDGNDLPYVPSQAYTFGIMYDWRDKLNVVFQGRYSDSRFSDGANTVAESVNGSVGEIGAYTVFDLKTRWQINDSLAIGAGVNNIFDKTYGTQRRTSQQKGLFPGPNREFYLSMNLEF
ncbi:MAG: TonB-dependent receptor [Luteolibacter sp.]